MALVLMGLGPFRFSVPGLSHNQLSRRYNYRWVPQWRIGRRPAEQFLGPGEEEVRIHGIIYPWAYGGYDQLEGMRGYAEGGIPSGLASAGGVFFGLWCIRAITDEQEYFLPDGTPRRVEFDLDLVNYGA